MHRTFFIHLSLFLLIPGAFTPAAASAAPPHPRQDNAVEIMANVDGKGQMFTLSIAAIGGIGAIGAGAWLLHQRPLPTQGRPSAFLFTNALLIAGTGVGQFVHAFMRLGERRASAAAASLLLDNPTSTREDELAYLRYRADQSHSTRFVGAVITTLQGVASTAAGLQLAYEGGSQHTGAAYTLSGLGVATTLIGSVHFFGKTRAQRELAAALSNERLARGPTLNLTPLFLADTSGQAIPGLGLLGHF